MTVTKIGGSLAIVIPEALARELKLKEGTSVDLRTNQAGINLRKRVGPLRRVLKDVVADIEPAAYARHTRGLSSDRAVGNEIW